MPPSCRRNLVAARRRGRQPAPAPTDLPPLPAALPAWESRRPTPSDRDRLLAVLESVDRATLGFSDRSRDDVEANATALYRSAGMDEDFAFEVFDRPVTCWWRRSAAPPAVAPVVRRAAPSAEAPARALRTPAARRSRLPRRPGATGRRRRRAAPRRRRRGPGRAVPPGPTDRMR